MTAPRAHPGSLGKPNRLSPPRCHAPRRTGQRPGGTDDEGRGRPPHGGALPRPHRGVALGSDRGGRAARGLDLGDGGGGERVRGHVDLDRDLALAEHLDRLVAADRTLGDQVLDRHGATLGEQCADLVEVDDLELHLEGVLEALELREPHVDGHLATLEGDRDLVAGLGALGTATRGLALRGLTATHAGLGGLGALGRAQVVQLERRHVTRPPRRSPGDEPC